MNYFDRAKFLLEAEIGGNVDNYLKSLNKQAVEEFKDKITQGYKVGIKFAPADSYSDIKATFDLFDPFNKQDVKEYRVTNIKTAREAREKLRAKERIPKEPKREDYENIGDFQQAMERWRREKAVVLQALTKKDETEYDKFGYPREVKRSRATLLKIKNYINDAASVNIVNAFASKNEVHIKKASDDLIDSAEKILAAVKIFSLGDFKKHPEEKENVYKNLFNAYNAAKKNPTNDKTLIDLKRSILSIKRQGTHSDTYLAASDATNNELYGYKKGREDVGKTVALADSAVGDLKYVSSLDMNDPKDVIKLKIKVGEIFKDMGLWKRGGPGGTFINPETRHFLGGEKKPTDDLESSSDTSKLFPENREQRDDFSKGMLTVKKMYNWLLKGFKDISNEEIKQDVLNIKKNGIVTLLALKHRATSPSTKSNVVDNVSSELKHIMDDIKKSKEARVNRQEDKAGGVPEKKLSAYELLKQQRG